MQNYRKKIYTNSHRQLWLGKQLCSRREGNGKERKNENKEGEGKNTVKNRKKKKKCRRKTNLKNITSYIFVNKFPPFLLGSPYNCKLPLGLIGPF